MGQEWVNLLLLLPLAAGGCMTKAKADAQARAAFVAGQQQAMQRMLQAQAVGPTVTFMGPVRNTFVPWTPELTLAKALVAASYLPPKDPSQIIIRRGGQEITVDPAKLLAGEDVPLEQHDIVELKP